jgi:hypothetical protein
LIVDDYYVARLNRDDHVRDLQSLYDRCPDYVQLAFGEPAHASAAEEDFAFQRNMVFGIYSRDAELIGVLELMRDYPLLMKRRQVTGDRSQETGHGRQVTGDRSQETGHRRQVTGDRSQVIGSVLHL